MKLIKMLIAINVFLMLEQFTGELFLNRKFTLSPDFLASTDIILDLSTMK